MTEATNPRERVFDVIVVGSGAAASAAAVAATARGSSVAVLEAAPQTGGTTARSGGIWWAPNNSLLRSAGYDDPKEDALRYMARASYPTKYDPARPKLGLSEYEYAMIEAYYDRVGPVTDRLWELGALTPAIHLDESTDFVGEALAYYDSFEWEDYHPLPENKRPTGRGLRPIPTDGEQKKAGLEMVQQMLRYVSANGGEVIVEHRVEDVYLNEKREVIGVRVTDGHGAASDFWARKGVIFGSGGFTHNPELRDRYLRRPIFGGCSVLTNQGILMKVSLALSAAIGNEEKAWWIHLPLEKALKEPSNPLDDIFNVPGDSLIIVNKEGKRTGNEKLPYQTRTQNLHFSVWDEATQSYPNRVLFMVWDQRTQDFYGPRAITMNNPDAAWIIKEDSLEALAANIERRLSSLTEATGSLQLDDHFAANLRATVERYKGFAMSGKDEDWQRGDTAYELSMLRLGGSLPADSKNNPTMFPISESGPYYCMILGAGTLDTICGPRINADGQVIYDNGAPIPGLYGCGNAVAAADPGAYWAGGGTLGMGLTFGFSAGEDASSQPDRLSGSVQRLPLLAAADDRVTSA